MEKLIAISPSLLTEKSWESQLPPLNPAVISQQNPDRFLVLIRNQRELVGHCSLWWQNVPEYPQQNLGLIGHYGAQDSAAADLLLEGACQQLAAAGCTLVIAPIDGNTWQRYRLLTERGNQPIFFLEPDNPDNWITHFSHQNFTPIAHYSSALTEDLNLIDPRLNQIANRLQTEGIKIRAIQLENIEAELHRIYGVINLSFRRNFLYTPVSEAKFILQYKSLLPYINPELVLIAEKNDKIIGFLLAIPDILQAQRGEKINTIIIKTVAILPQRVYRGLGRWLVAICQEKAVNMGFTRAIHALMHDANPSRNLSLIYAQSIRHYALFGKYLYT